MSVIQDLASKADIAQMEMRLTAKFTEKIESAKHETLKWLITLLVAQTALLAAVLAMTK